jgi:hypothetical protein
MKYPSRFYSPTFFAGVAFIVAVACGSQRENRELDSLETRPLDAPDSSCGGTTLSGTGIGALRIGMSVDSVRALCRVLSDTTRLATEGQRARFIGVQFGAETVEAEIVNDRVWRIDVRSPSFRTSDGLGVGTPLSRLLSMKSPRGLTGEGQLFVVSPDHCRLSFRLSDNGSSARSQNWDRAALARLPATTIVDRVLAIGCD